MFEIKLSKSVEVLSNILDHLSLAMTDEKVETFSNIMAKPNVLNLLSISGYNNENLKTFDIKFPVFWSQNIGVKLFFTIVSYPTKTAYGTY